MQTDTAAFEKLHQYALLTLKESSAGQTNQFEVYDQLEGLEEKFRIFNNDELADAIYIRRQELSDLPNKWKPEILSLLLHLSDSPAEKSNIKDLDSLKRLPSPEPLAWDQIIAEDPLDNQDGIWDTIDYASESSDDEAVTPEISVGSEATERSTTLEDDLPIFGDVSDKLDDKKLLNEITKSQFWRESYDHDHQDDRSRDTEGLRATVNITETQIVRESIFMLLGLPTTVFSLNSQGCLHPSPRYTVRYASQEAVQGSLEAFASLGNKLLTIREWTKRKETVTFIQTLQTAIASRLKTVDDILTDIQERIIHPHKSRSVTLLNLLSDIQKATHSLTMLVPIVSAKAFQEKHKPFALLEKLYDLINSTESIGDIDTCQYLTKVLLEGFRTYLKPVSKWMVTGELDEANQTFFVGRNEQHLPLTSLWSSQYRLLYDDNGDLFAPKFLRLAAKKIFTTGKSVIFLNRLGQNQAHEPKSNSPKDEQGCEKFYADGTFSSLCPFEELFSLALDNWIASKHHSSSLRLRKLLDSDCGLWTSLDALEHIYFFCNGALGSQIASSIFRRIDQAKIPWNDRFVLTGLFHETFVNVNCVDINRLVIRPSPEGHSTDQSLGRSVRSFASIEVNYTLPWAVAIIVNPRSQRIYQTIYVFLLQVERAKQLLQRIQPSKGLALTKDEGNDHRVILSLRHRLLWFVNILQTYLTSAVLQKASAEMRIKMEKAEDLDEMIEVHRKYVLQLEHQCLLSSKLSSVHQAIISLLELTVLFYDLCSSSLERSASTKPALSHRKNSSTRMQRAKLRSQDETFTSDDSEGESEYEEAVEYHLPDGDAFHSDRLRNLSTTYAKLLSFVMAGLLEINRTGAEPCWEVLIDSLSIGLIRSR